jgi:hypothetical protein
MEVSRPTSDREVAIGEVVSSGGDGLIAPRASRREQMADDPDYHVGTTTLGCLSAVFQGSRRPARRKPLR